MYKNEQNIFIHIYDTSNRNPAKSAISFVASLFLLRPEQSIELLIGFYLSPYAFFSFCHSISIFLSVKASFMHC